MLSFANDLEWMWGDVGKVLSPLVTPFGLLLAAMVTAHVLLRKRDVDASIGWIGLAWLAPVWGPLLYFILGINRVTRRARRARGPRQPRRRATDLPAYDIAQHFLPLEKAIRRITNRMAETDNAFEVFHDGDTTYPVMLAAIADATSSVVLSTYIMWDDAVGIRFVEALKAAKDRGVEVRVLIDGIGSGYFPPIFRRLKRNGIPAALFMHSALPWRMPFLNLRSHKKLLVVDGTVGFTGGMNISAANLVAQHPPHPVSDTHFRFRGSVVTQLMDAFAQDWFFTTGNDLEGPVWFPDLKAEGSSLARVVTSGPDQDLEKIRSVLLEACACAHSSIKIMTPYFLPGSDLVMALELAALRGVRVDVIVPQKSDHRFVDHAMRAHIGPLLEHGVRFWAGPPPFNHSKLMVVDKHWCLVGSANWDMRSLRLNFELNVEVYSEELAQQLDAFMLTHQTKRLRARELNARNLPVRLRDAGLRLLLPYI